MPAGASNRILILGASGQLGRLAAEHVLRRREPAEVILVSRTPRALGQFAERGCTVRFGDLDDPDSLREAFSGASRMLLISASDLERRTEQHRAGIRSAVRAGVGHIVYTSGLNPEPPNPAVISPSHHATECALADSGIAWTIMRESLYSEYQAPEAAAAVATGVLAHNRADGQIAYVSRDDCAATAAAVLATDGHQGMVYDVTGPRLFDAAQLAALYAELAGREVATEELDDGALADLIAASAGEDDHARYGAVLVASLGRSVREGYMSSCTGVVEELTGRPARSLRAVLAADPTWTQPVR